MICIMKNVITPMYLCSIVKVLLKKTFRSKTFDRGHETAEKHIKNHKALSIDCIASFSLKEVWIIITSSYKRAHLFMKTTFHSLTAIFNGLLTDYFSSTLTRLKIDAIFFITYRFVNRRTQRSIDSTAHISSLRWNSDALFFRCPFFPFHFNNEIKSGAPISRVMT